MQRGGMVDEIDVDIKVSEDKKEMTIKLTSVLGTKLSTESVVMELEYLINQFAKAEDEKNRGARDH